MASLILHPSGVPLLLLLVALTPISGCTPSSKNLPNIKFTNIGQGTFFLNVTLNPISIKTTFTPLDTEFLDKLTKFLKKFNTFQDSIFKHQIKLAAWTITNLKNLFSTLNSPPKITRGYNENVETITRDFFSQDLQEAATAPLLEILGTPIPTESAKAGLILNSVMTELSLLKDLIKEEYNGYLRVINGKLTNADLRLIKQNSNFINYTKVGIEFLQTSFEKTYISVYNCYLLSDPINIPHIRPDNLGPFKLKRPTFYFYNEQAVIFKKEIPKNILTLQVIYTASELKDLRTSTNLQRYLEKKPPIFFDQQSWGNFLLNPNASGTTFPDIYEQLKDQAGNFSLNMGRNFIKIIGEKTGLTYLRNNNSLTDEDILNLIDSIFRYLPPYWEFYLALIIGFVISIAMIIYLLYKKRLKSKLRGLEKKDIHSIHLLEYNNKQPTQFTKN